MTAMFLMLACSMVLLRLKAAACMQLELRRVLRFQVVPRTGRRPVVAGVVGVRAKVEGVLARWLATLPNTGGLADLLRLDAARMG